MPSVGMPNYGLISTMADGIKEGMTTYMTLQNAKRQQQQLGLLTGMQQDDQGNWQLNAQGQQKQQLAQQQMQRSQDQMDPNSQYSKDHRAFARGLIGDTSGSIIPDTMSAGDVDSEDSLLKEKMQADAIKEAAKYKLQNSNEHFSSTENDKTNNRWSQFATAINNPSNRSQIGSLQQNINKSETLKKLVGTLPGYSDNMSHDDLVQTLNQANPQQTYEIAKAADQLTSAAQGSVYGTDHLMPNDMAFGGAKASQWVSAGSVPANQGEILAKYFETAKREGDYYKSTRDNAVSGIAAGYDDLKDKNPSKWNAVLASTIAPGAQQPQQQGQSPQPNPSGYGLMQQSAPAQQQVSPEDQAAISWAKLNPKDPRAQKILQMHGG